MRVLKVLCLLLMFVGQFSFAATDVEIDRSNEWIQTLACGMAQTADDNTLTFYSLVGSELTSLKVYDLDGGELFSQEVFADSDGCFIYALKSSEVPSYASLVVEEKNGTRHVLIKGEPRPEPNPTPVPTPPNSSDDAYNKGFQSGQLVAQVYNESLAFMAYVRLLVSDDLLSDFSNAHVQALTIPDSYLTSSEEAGIKREMTDLAQSEAQKAAVSFAQNEAKELVYKSYSEAAVNAQQITPDDVYNLPTPSPVFTAPPVNVGEEYSAQDFFNPVFVGLYVENAFLDDLYRDYLEVLYRNWPASVFRSSQLFNYDSWNFEIILDDRSFEHHLEVIQDNIQASGRFDYVTGFDFQSNEPRLLEARRKLLIEVSNEVLYVAQGGFIDGFNQAYYPSQDVDYRELLNTILSTQGKSISDFQNLIEEQKAEFVHKAAKILVASNYKVAVFESEFATTYVSAAENLFIDQYVETLESQINKFETQSVLDFSQTSLTLETSGELGMLSNIRVAVTGVRNIGKKPATALPLRASVAGSTLAVNVPLNENLEFGALSQKAVSDRFEIPYNVSNLSYSSSTNLNVTSSGAQLGNLSLTLLAKTYVENFANNFETICPPNADRTQRRFCNDRKTQLGDVLGEEVRSQGDESLYNYYESFQPNSIVWALTEIESSRGLSDLLTHKYRRSSSVTDRVRSYRPGWLGNRKVKAMFDDVAEILEDVAR